MFFPFLADIELSDNNRRKRRFCKALIFVIMDKNILEELRSQVILSSKNVVDLKHYISLKYASSSQSEKAHVLADAINRVIDKGTPDFEKSQNANLRNSIIRIAISRESINIDSSDILVECLKLKSNEDAFFAELCGWFNKTANKNLSEREIKSFAQSVYNQSESNIDLEIEEVINKAYLNTIEPSTYIETLETNTESITEIRTQSNTESIIESTTEINVEISTESITLIDMPETDYTCEIEETKIECIVEDVCEDTCFEAICQVSSYDTQENLETAITTNAQKEESLNVSEPLYSEEIQTGCISLVEELYREYIKNNSDAELIITEASPKNSRLAQFERLLMLRDKLREIVEGILNAASRFGEISEGILNTASRFGEIAEGVFNTASRFGEIAESYTSGIKLKEAVLAGVLSISILTMRSIVFGKSQVVEGHTNGIYYSEQMPIAGPNNMTTRPANEININTGNSNFSNYNKIISADNSNLYYSTKIVTAKKSPVPVSLQKSSRSLSDRTVKKSDEPKTLDLSNKKMLKMRATAYDLSMESCGKPYNDPEYGITFSGTKATLGRTVAVDSSIIPLGSKLYIEFPSPYKNLSGTYIAEDTGNQVKGDIIDVFFGEDKVGESIIHYEAENFGVRSVEVYMLDK